MKVSSSKKHEKERLVLCGLVDLYIKTGKPIGSNTLKESGFDHLSSATIRNYFLKLEEEGYLSQQHSSGGRLPTDLAYKFYIEHGQSKESSLKSKKRAVEKKLVYEDKEVVTYLIKVIELIAEETGCASLISSPRFDHDFVVEIKLVGLDAHRLLCILMTSFGMVSTEIFYIPEKISNFTIKRIESYFAYQRLGQEKPQLDPKELALAEHLYNELLLRHIVGHATFTKEDVYKTGFTHLLRYPELQETGALANTLSLFENPYLIQKLCEESQSQDNVKIWVGSDLEDYHRGCRDCSLLMIPYKIKDKKVGTIGLLGPTRIPYKELSDLLKVVSKGVSETLNSLLFKYEMSYRIPQTQGIDFKNEKKKGSSSCLMIDDRTKKIKQ